MMQPTGLFSLRSAELIERLLMQEANLSQVSLRFCNVAPYDTQLFPDCNLARMMQRGFKALSMRNAVQAAKAFRFCTSSLVDMALSSSLPEPSVERDVNLFVLPLQIATGSADC